MTLAQMPLPAEAATLYSKLEDRVLDRDQVGASDVFYDLVRTGRSLPEMLRETIRIHAPYTHVPYHQRVENGVVRFVNNDHCLLSARIALRLPRLLGPGYEFLPMAQTVWYVPTGLDIWNQLAGKMPGHYNRRGYSIVPGTSAESQYPVPLIHWQDQEPISLQGTLDEKLNEWLSTVQRGQVERAYGIFLGLLRDHANERDRILSQLVFAGLIDVQDRMIFNRSYTTGHKAYRARATVELGDTIGWDDAHAVVYAGVLDIAVGPRWHSNYEMAGEVSWITLSENGEQQVSSISPTPELPPERRLLANEASLTTAEADMLLYALTKAPDPAFIDAISTLLLAGRSARSIVDVMQVAAAQLILETGDPRNYSMSQHCSEYMNTLGWFYDRFDHPHRIKLLYVAGSFISQTAHWIRNSPGTGEANTMPPREAASLTGGQILQRLDEAMVNKSPVESVSWVRAYTNAGHDTKPLIRTLALGAAKQGNDTHNQELGLVFLEDYEKTSARHRDLLLRASAQHTAGHMKYGDSLEPYRRFADAFNIDSNSNQQTQGDADPVEALLD